MSLPFLRLGDCQMKNLGLIPLNFLHLDACNDNVGVRATDPIACGVFENVLPPVRLRKFVSLIQQLSNLVSISVSQLVVHAIRPFDIL